MISVLHPSRGRPEMAYNARQQWVRTSSKPFEHIMSLDQDDEKIMAYRKHPYSESHRILINRNRSVVDAVNNAARVCIGDLIVVMSDDFVAPQGWDEIVWEKYMFLKDLSKSNLVAILVGDGIQTDLTTMTLPIVSKALYQRLGFIYHPDYFSVFADNDITETCRELGCLSVHPDIVFEHHHYLNGKNKIDATYRRENSSEAFSIGRKVYDRRKAKHFNI